MTRSRTRDDFGNGESAHNFIVARFGTSSDLALQVYNGSDLVSEVKISSAIVQEQWMTIVGRYRAQDQTYALEGNGQQATLTTSVALTDKTLSSTWVGRSHWSGDEYFNCDIAGLYVTDEYASDGKSALIANALRERLDLAELPCIDCVAGMFSAAVGATVCADCGAGTYSAASAATVCTSI